MNLKLAIEHIKQREKILRMAETMTSTDIPVLIPGKMRFRKNKKAKKTKTGFIVTTV